MQKYVQAYSMYTQLMSQGKQLSKIQNLLVLVHSINRTNNLVCLVDEQQCQYPVNWKNIYEDTYSFTYRNDRKHTILNVRATERGTKLEIIFSEVGSSQSYRVLLILDQTVQQSAKKYDFTLQQYFKESQSKGRNLQVRRQTNKNNFSSLQQSQPQSGYTNNLRVDNVGYPPRNLINPPNTINNPFGQEEYVGPNSQIFVNPYQNQQPNQGSLRIPPGARYDKVDPFDNPLQDNRFPNSPHDFFGFDEFGRPKRSPFSNENRGGINGGFGGRGGFGGGVGGGFGGGFGGRGGFGDHFGV